jgi:3-oxoacyl-[acyl-carrier protein] reductase
VVSLLTGGVIDSIPADFEGRDALIESLVAPTLLGRGAMLEDVGNVAAFVASDRHAPSPRRRSTSPAEPSSPERDHE